MTICALLLRHRFYSLKPSEVAQISDARLVLCQNLRRRRNNPICVPPVVIVASVWNWELVYMLTNFGGKAVIGIIFSNLLYLAVFRKEFARLAANVPGQEGRRPIPWQITGINILFLF
jgi:hypothetical protein